MVFQLFFGGWALGRGTKNRQILWKDTKDNDKTCSLRSAAPPPASVLQIGCIKQEAQLLHWEIAFSTWTLILPSLPEKEEYLFIGLLSNFYIPFTAVQ